MNERELRQHLIDQGVLVPAERAQLTDRTGRGRPCLQIDDAGRKQAAKEIAHHARERAS